MGEPTLSALADQLEQLQQRVDDLEAERDELRDELETERRRRRDAERRVAELEEDVDDLDKETTILDSRLDATVDGLDRLEARLETGDLGSSADAEDDAPTVATETPLEEVVALDESVADRELSPNQQRARFVAADLRDYTTSAPAGRVVSASEIARVLKAGTDADGHAETVRRVMKILDELGKDDVELVRRHGEKRLAFDEQLVARLELVTDETHSVVSRAEG